LCSVLEITEKKYPNYIKDAEFCKGDDDLYLYYAFVIAAVCSKLG